MTIVNATSSGMTAPTGTYVLNAHPVSSKLTAWLVLSILRAVCCLLGWMIMSWFTKYDRLRGTCAYIRGSTKEHNCFTNEKISAGVSFVKMINLFMLKLDY